MLWVWSRRQGRKRGAAGDGSSEGSLRSGVRDQVQQLYRPAHELRDEGAAAAYDYNKHRKGELDSSHATLPPQELLAEVRPDN